MGPWQLEKRQPDGGRGAREGDQAGRGYAGGQHRGVIDEPIVHGEAATRAVEVGGIHCNTNTSRYLQSDTSGCSLDLVYIKTKVEF